MCPFIALVVLFQILILICDVTSIKIDIQLPKDNKIRVLEGEQKTFEYNVTDASKHTKIHFVITDPEIATVEHSYEELYQQKFFNSSFKIRGKYIGATQLNIFYSTSEKKNEEVKLETIRVVTMLHKNTTLQTIFTVLVSILVGLNTINMGCALDLDIVKISLKSPVNLLVGFFTHYGLMPILAYLIGKVLFEDQEHLRLR